MVRNGLHATMIENVDDCDEWWDDTLIVNGLENKSIGEEDAYEVTVERDVVEEEDGPFVVYKKDSIIMQRADSIAVIAKSAQKVKQVWNELLLMKPSFKVWEFNLWFRYFPVTLPRSRKIYELFAGSAQYAVYWAGQYNLTDVVLCEMPEMALLWNYILNEAANGCKNISTLPVFEDDPSTRNQILKNPNVDGIIRWYSDRLVKKVETSLRKDKMLTQFTHTDGSYVSDGGEKLFLAKVTSRGTGTFQPYPTSQAILSWTSVVREKICNYIPELLKGNWEVVTGENPFMAGVNKALAETELVTVFVDPPYQDKAGTKYLKGMKGINFDELKNACKKLAEKGHQVIITESIKRSLHGKEKWFVELLREISPDIRWIWKRLSVKKQSGGNYNEICIVFNPDPTIELVNRYDTTRAAEIETTKHEPEKEKSFPLRFFPPSKRRHEIIPSPAIFSYYGSKATLVKNTVNLSSLGELLFHDDRWLVEVFMDDNTEIGASAILEAF